MMKKMTLLFLSFICLSSFSQSVFINEIHYDNIGTDINEAIEIAGPAGTDLTLYSLELYRDVGTIYDTIALTGIIPDQQDGFGTLSFPILGIQNGAADGIALVEGSTLIQFLSYEGVLTATDGTAVGMTSTDIGVQESASTLTTESLQLIGAGTVYTDFTWQAPTAATQGTINTGQTFSNITLSNPAIDILKSSVEIFPNPSINGKVTFRNHLNEEVKFSVYNSLGGLVSEKRIEGSQIISTENLTSGVYFVQLSTESGSITKRLMVK